MLKSSANRFMLKLSPFAEACDSDTSHAFQLASGEEERTELIGQLIVCCSFVCCQLSISVVAVNETFISIQCIHFPVYLSASLSLSLGIFSLFVHICMLMDGPGKSLQC